MVIWVAGRLAYGYITQDTNGRGAPRENGYGRVEYHLVVAYLLICLIVFSVFNHFYLISFLKVTN